MDAKVPIIAIDRHRIYTDGEGITTLVAFYGCPLRCRYCINSQCFSETYEPEWITPKQLYDRTRIDELYFLATGGGITFGGGEPCLNPEFIVRFREIAGPDWKIYLETSLNVPTDYLKRLMPVIDGLIIDVKDMNNEIYRRYTGRDNDNVLQNLDYIASQDRQSDCQIRLPLIRDYNTDSDRDKSEKQLRHLGFDNIERFTYIINRHHHE